MKKRIAAVMLAAILVMTGCGAVSDSGQPQEGSSVQTLVGEELSGQTTAQEGLGESSQEQGSAGETADHEAGNVQEMPEDVPQGVQPPIVSQEELLLQKYMADGETLLAEIRDDVVTVSGAGYEKAAETIDRLCNRPKQELETELAEMAESAQQIYDEQKEYYTEGDYWYFANFSTTKEYTVTRIDTRVISLQEFAYDYSGGAHGNYGITGVTVDAVTGLKLELPHLVSDFAGFLAKAEEKILENLSQRKDELYEDYENYVAQYISSNLENISWYLSGEGIEFLFSPYEIAPYAAGTIQVTVPYTEITAFMKPEYCGMQGAGVGVIPASREFTVALSDGKTHTFFVGEQASPDDPYYYDFILSFDGNRLEDAGYGWIRAAYLLRRADGSEYLLYTADGASDDNVTYLWNIEGDTLRKTAMTDVNASVTGKNLTPDSVEANILLYVLGTYSAKMNYTITADGALVQQADRLVITNHNDWNLLTVKKELPVTVDGAQTVLPVGTELWLTAVDLDGTVWFQTLDGSVEGTIRYEHREEDYQLFIDGVSEFEYFENLPYAG